MINTIVIINCILLVVQFFVIYLLVKLIRNFVSSFSHLSINNTDHDISIGSHAPIVRTEVSNGDNVVIGKKNAKYTLLLFVSDTCSICIDILNNINTNSFNSNVMDVFLVGEKKLNIDFPFILSQDIIKLYTVKSVPTVVVIDKEGFILLVEGLRGYTQFQKIVEMLEIKNSYLAS